MRASSLPVVVLAVLPALIACAPATSSETTEPASTTPAEVTPSTPEAPAAANSVGRPSGCTTGIATTDGCRAAYTVSTDGALEGLSKTCSGGTSLYNDCSSSPIGLHFIDSASDAPHAVTVELQTSIFCAHPDLVPEAKQEQLVLLNGKPIGKFEGDRAACTCAAAPTLHSFTLDSAALAAYRPGQDNTIQITGPNRCLGLQKNDAWSGGLARITATY